LKQYPIKKYLYSLTGVYQILRITLVLYILAFILKLYNGSDVSSMLVVTRGWSETDAYWTEKSIAIFLILLAVWLFIKPVILNTFLLMVFLIINAIIVYENAGRHFYELSFLSAMAKWVLPLLYLSVYLNLKKPDSGFVPKWLFFLTRFSLFLIFFVHGLGCLWTHPGYIDYIIGTLATFSGSFMKQSIAENILIFIGVVDVIIAILVLIRPWRNVLIWMVVWGLLTSFLRIVDAGIFNYTEFLIRVPHFTLPLVCLLLYKIKKPAFTK
jgi:hypothetical protein